MSAQPLEPAPSPEPPPLYFLVIPGEGADIRDARWNKVVKNAQSAGWTILGTGPDLDWPVRYELVQETNPAGAFYEVFRLIPLDQYHDLISEDEVV